MHQSKWRVVHNSQGYTLLEALFSFSVFVILAQILLVVLFWIQQMNTTYFTNEDTAWEFFVYDFQQSLVNVKEIKLSNDSKTVDVFYINDVKKINRSGDVLRLIINNQGNTPLLIGVRSALFNWDGQFLTLSVIFNNGVEKERRFFVQKITQ
ncbi:ComGF family competence protein [Lysinibacillus sp. SGAir0095]|uniref:ComGF family competence protein n=1 Tax=Lysinibacillus sp. SGAir0095 TaxID=2070463 RepID=UPI0010CD036A|nr:ComGF family competence protein [Lysinibacillus sp. SGAir0095]QCR32842.1 hypothetical protein C1N55_11950 [Lysinibacillus sp. SGAir0095]